MKVFADTHVHFYPCFDLTRALECAWKNFSRFSDSSITSAENYRVLYLTERSDCHVFRELQQRPERLIDLNKFSVHPCNEQPEVLRVQRTDGGEMFLVAGRQISTVERLEVLALHTLCEFSDGLGFRESIHAARESGAVTVLNWSLGKWMFGRGKLVADVIQSAAQNDFIVGDILGRPLGWGEPALVRIAQERGCLMVAGSDPLPFPGEEVGIASYFSVIESIPVPEESIPLPGKSEPIDRKRWFFRDILRDRSGDRNIVGRRNTSMTAGIRLWKNAAAKRLK